MNKAKDIQEGNILIAEVVCEKSGERIYKWKMFDDLWADEGLKFDSSWGWLMAAVEKIESLEKKRFGFHIDPHDISIVDYKSESENAIVYSTRQEYSLKEALYDAVKDFIVWYNKLNKEPDVQASVATGDDSSNQADNIKKITHE